MVAARESRSRRGPDDPGKVRPQIEADVSTEESFQGSLDADVEVALVAEAHLVDIHRERHRSQHSAVEPREVVACPLDVARQTGHHHRGRRGRSGHQRRRIELDLQLGLDLRPGVVRGFGNERLSGKIVRTPAAGCLAGRGRAVDILGAGQRIEAEDDRAVAHDFDATRLIGPFVAQRRTPGIEQPVERSGPDPALGQQRPVRRQIPRSCRPGRPLPHERHAKSRRRLDPRRQVGIRQSAGKGESHGVVDTQMKGKLLLRFPAAFEARIGPPALEAQHGEGTACIIGLKPGDLVRHARGEIQCSIEVLTNAPAQAHQHRQQADAPQRRASAAECWRGMRARRSKTGGMSPVSGITQAQASLIA